MKERKIQGLQLAVVQKGKIILRLGVGKKFFFRRIIAYFAIEIDRIINNIELYKYW